MKQYLMVIGMKIVVHNEITKIMEMTLKPLTNIETKPNTKSVKGIINFGKQIAKGMVHEEKNSIIYVPCNECYPFVENGYKIGRHITLDINMDNTTGGIDNENNK